MTLRPADTRPTHVALHARSHTWLWAGDDGWLYREPERTHRYHYMTGESSDFGVLDLAELRRARLLLQEIPRAPRRRR